MAGEVWVRGYAESYGASVEWDEATQEVIIDGYRIKPSFIAEGKAYVPKETIDAILMATGRMGPYGSNRYIEDVYSREAIEEELRPSPASRGIVDFFRRYNPIAVAADAFERAKAWVLEHIWKPITSWWDELIDGFLGVWSSLSRIPASLLVPFRRIRLKFEQWWENAKEFAQSVGNWVYDSLFPYVKGAVEWIDSVRTHISILTESWWDRLRWYVSDVWEDIRIFFTDPVAAVAALVVAGWHWWWEKVEGLLEDYIDLHWEDEV